jgi:hypothetical protein
MARIGIFFAACTFAAAAEQAVAATYTVATATGNWSDSATWNVASGYPDSSLSSSPPDVAQATQANNATNPSRSTTLNVSPTLGTLQSTSTGDWTVAASGSNFITMSVASGNATIGRTNNNSNAGLITINPDLQLASNTIVMNRGGTTSSSSEGVRIGGSITNAGSTSTANLFVQQGNNSGANEGGRRIAFGGLVNNTGNLSLRSVSSAATTGQIRFEGGIGVNVQQITLESTLKSTAVLGGTYSFTLGATPDLVDVNGGTLDISGATIAFTGTPTLPSYTLVDYSDVTSTSLVLATNPATDNTFASASGVPAGYSIVHDTASERILLVVPEPSAFAALSLGLAALLRRRGR